MAQVLTNALATESKVLDSGKTLAVLERETTATCVSMFGPNVDRTFISTYGAAKTATVAQLLGKSGDIDALDATHVHIGGFYVCKGIHAGLPAAVKRLKVRGVKVSMDPNFDAAGEWTPAAMLAVIRVGLYKLISVYP
jgi:sugar/nucleoside kinase (ribokinase family)